MLALILVHAHVVGAAAVLAAPVQRFLYDVCEPYLRFWRRLLPLSFGAIDFSPIVAILALLAVDCRDPRRDPEQPF